MDFELTEEQQMIRQISRDFAEGELSKVADINQKERLFPKAILKKMAELGLMGINIPEEYGGSQAGVIAYVLAIIEISRICASTSVTMAVTNMVGEAIVRFGSEELKRKYVPCLTSGEYMAGAFALTEAAAGSDAKSIKTSIVEKGDRYIVNGNKMFITSGTYAGVAIVLGKLQPEGQMCALLIEPNFKGFRVGREEEKMGLKASNTVELIFEDCEVPLENRLGQIGEGFKIALTALDGGRIGVASQSIGIATAALECATNYARERKQFGKTLAEFQAIQWMLADSATELEAAKLLTLRAAHLKEQGKKFTREASMAKLFASEKANQICQRAFQIHGGYGYVTDFPVERYLRDVRVTTIYEGTSEIQRLVIARSLLE